MENLTQRWTKSEHFFFQFSKRAREACPSPHLLENNFCPKKCPNIPNVYNIYIYIYCSQAESTQTILGKKSINKIYKIIKILKLHQVFMHNLFVPKCVNNATCE